MINQGLVFTEFPVGLESEAQGYIDYLNETPDRFFRMNRIQPSKLIIYNDWAYLGFIENLVGRNNPQQLYLIIHEDVHGSKDLFNEIKRRNRGYDLRRHETDNKSDQFAIDYHLRKGRTSNTFSEYGRLDAILSTFNSKIMNPLDTLLGLIAVVDKETPSELHGLISNAFYTDVDSGRKREHLPDSFSIQDLHMAISITSPKFFYARSQWGYTLSQPSLFGPYNNPKVDISPYRSKLKKVDQQYYP